VTLQLGTDVADIRFAPRYNLQPLSAEAEVEGLATGDFASVRAQWVKGALVAQRVQFDIDPVLPLRMVTGVITWASPNGKRLRVRLADTGKVRPVEIARDAHYDMDNRPQSGQLTVLKDESVQLLVVKIPFDWLATELNVKTTQTSSRFVPYSSLS
jgi:hypothetical protein